MISGIVELAVIISSRTRGPRSITRSGSRFSSSNLHNAPEVGKLTYVYNQHACAARCRKHADAGSMDLRAAQVKCSHMLETKV